MEFNTNEQKPGIPNLAAQTIRHSRVFLRSLFFSRGLFRFVLDAKVLIKNIQARFFKKRASNVLFDMPMIVSDPFKKFAKQTVVIGAALLIVTSIAPTHLLETGFTAEAFEADTDYIMSEDELMPPAFMMNEEGFVLKTAPVSEEVNRIGFTDSVKHTVVSGDTLSSIAMLYGINVKTLVWENNISEESTLKIGQTLIIPAIDGVSYTVAAKSETLASIAKSFNADPKLIKEHNNLSGDILTKGQKVFVPGGKKKEVPIVIVRSGSRSGGRIAAANTFNAKLVISTDETPDEGKKLIYPTDGTLTQGYHAGHYANDIANPSKPDVWAAAGGTVIKAEGGCLPRNVKIDRRCGGGYGNYIVMDHGDGLQTLYAHLETIYVSDGQQISRGQAIGKMGNTGRAYGVTGIHLHFEVYDNGVKKNPANYF